MPLPESVVDSPETSPASSDNNVSPVTGKEMIKSDPIQDRDALENKVEAALKATFTDSEDSDIPTEDATPAPENKTEEATEAADADSDKQAVLSEDKPTPDAGTPPTLPAAYVRSLKAMDWSEEDIAEAAKRPELLPTIAKIHATRNKEIQAWAEMGRKAKQGATNPLPKQETQKASGGLTPVDVEALKKKYGDDIADITGPVNRAIEQINALLPLIEQTQRFSQQSQQEQLGQHIESFFGGKELEPFSDVYGSAKKGLSEKHLESRTKVLEMADALIAGAKQQGRDLSLGEALAFAHDSVSSGFKDQAARATIRKQMQTRERGISLKPGGSKTPAPSNIKSRSDLEKKVETGMKKVFTS